MFQGTGKQLVCLKGSGEGGLWGDTSQPSASQQNPILGRARRKVVGCRDYSRAGETVALGWPGGGGVRDLCWAQQPGEIQRKLNE